MLSTLLLLAVAASPSEPVPLLLLPPAALKGVAGASADAAVVGRLEAELEKALIAVAERGRVIDPTSAEAPPPPAAVVPAEIQALRGRAEAAARDADYGAAVRLYGELVDSLEQRLLEVGAIDPLVDARLELARLYQGTGEPGLMSSELSRVARLAPGLVLDMRRYPPPIVEGLALAHAALEGEPAAELVFEVQPAGAQLFVDGVSVGIAPLTHRLPAGPHLVWLSAAGRKGQARALSLAPGSRSVVEVTLEQEPVHAVASALFEEARGEARYGPGEQLARALVREAGGSVVVLAAAAPLGDGYLVVVRRLGAGDRIAYGTLGNDLEGLAPLSRALIAAALDDAELEGDGDEVRVNAPGAAELEVPGEWIASAHLFGYAPPTPPSSLGEEEASVWASPWLWLGVGSAVVLVGGGAAAAAGAALLSPQPQVIQDVDRVQVSVEVAP